MAVRLFVGNLPYEASEEEIRQHFSTVGNLSYVSIPIDRETGKKRGFAFVEMGVDAEGNAAISGLNGRDLDGRALNVNEAKPKTERASGGGNRGGGRSNSRW